MGNLSFHVCNLCICDRKNLVANTSIIIHHTQKTVPSPSLLVLNGVFVSLPKALGCKRVHDDRIAGVTFVENASSNALIVDKEEYVWAGNPFPNPKKKGKSSGILPFSFVCRCMRNSAHATSKRPFQGPGMSARIRGNARAQVRVRVRVRVPFSAPKQEGRIQKVLSSFAYRNRKADIDNLRMHVQGGDMADTASHRRTYTQHRPPFSLQRSETEQSESIFLNMHVFIASSPDLLLPLQHSRHIHPHPGRVSSSRTSTSTL